MRKPCVSRDDYSEWSREVPPGGANSTVRDCSASISSSAVLQPFARYPRIFFLSGLLVAVRFSAAPVSQSGNLFVAEVRPPSEANGSDAKTHRCSRFEVTSRGDISFTIEVGILRINGRDCDAILAFLVFLHISRFHVVFNSELFFPLIFPLTVYCVM